MVNNMKEQEQFNMAEGYLKRIDKLLSAADEAQINKNGSLWYNILISLYKEVYAKMDANQKAEANNLIKNLNEARTKSIESGDNKLPISFFLNLELFLRNVLEDKNLLTPKSNGDIYE